MPHKEINQQTLVQLFEDAYDSEGIRLCFLLGAGASVSSGIPTGATLAKILADTRHSFIITTNFDYLVEDALSDQ